MMSAKNRTVLFIVHLAAVVLITGGCSTENIKTVSTEEPSGSSRIEPSFEEPKSCVYTIKSSVNVRSSPDVRRLSLEELDQNQTLGVLAKDGDWYHVKTPSGSRGYVHKDMVSDTWIKVHKKERRLYLVKKDTILKSYRVALSSKNPYGDKVELGDGGTPEGRFYICQTTADPSRLKYGPRSMLLTYPNSEDARRGLKEGLIDNQTYLDIIKNIKAGRIPSQKTRLGSQIRIHGCGSKYDWTAGCVAMDDKDIIGLFTMVCSGTRVEIYRSAAQDRELNGPGYLNRRILEGAKRELAKPTRYAYQSAAAVQADCPAGGSAARTPVTAETIIRALRYASLDVPALVQEDTVLHPWRYSSCTAKTSGSRDYAQLCNLTIYFYHHSLVLPNTMGIKYYKYCKPGDVVVMHSGAAKGIDFDRIGIVDDTYDSNGLPNIITVWQKETAALSKPAADTTIPSIRYCFRMTHPFDYQ